MSVPQSFFDTTFIQTLRLQGWWHWPLWWQLEWHSHVFTMYSQYPDCCWTHTRWAKAISHSIQQFLARQKRGRYICWVCLRCLSMFSDPNFIQFPSRSLASLKSLRLRALLRDQCLFSSLYWSLLRIWLCCMSILEPVRRYLIFSKNWRIESWGSRAKSCKQWTANRCQQ